MDNSSDIKLVGSRRRNKARVDSAAGTISAVPMATDSSLDINEATRKYQANIKGLKHLVSNTHITLDGTIQSHKLKGTESEYNFVGAVVNFSDIDNIVEISPLNERKHENSDLLDTTDIDNSILEKNSNSDPVLCYLLNDKLFVVDGQRRVVSCLRNKASLRISFIEGDPYKNTNLKLLLKQLSRSANKTQKTGLFSKIRWLKRELLEQGYSDIESVTRNDIADEYKRRFRDDFSSPESLRICKDMIDKFDESFVSFFGNEDGITVSYLKELRALIKRAEKEHYDNEESPHYKIKLFSKEGTKHLVDYYYCNDEADTNFIEYLGKKFKVNKPMAISNESLRKDIVKRFLKEVLISYEPDSVSKRSSIYENIATVSTKDIDKSYTINITDASIIPFEMLEKLILDLVNKENK